LNRRYRNAVTDGRKWQRIARNYHRTLRSTRDELTQVLREVETQKKELAEFGWKSDRLEAELEICRTQVKNLVKENSRMNTALDASIARDVAAAARATQNGSARQEEYL
jgi:predicted nuclease with TOPRIM domain